MSRYLSTLSGALLMSFLLFGVTFAGPKTKTQRLKAITLAARMACRCQGDWECMKTAYEMYEIYNAQLKRDKLSDIEKKSRKFAHWQFKNCMLQNTFLYGAPFSQNVKLDLPKNPTAKQQKIIQLLTRYQGQFISLKTHNQEIPAGLINITDKRLTLDIFLNLDQNLDFTDIRNVSPHKKYTDATVDSFVYSKRVLHNLATILHDEQQAKIALYQLSNLPCRCHDEECFEHAEDNFSELSQGIRDSRFYRAYLDMLEIAKKRNQYCQHYFYLTRTPPVETNYALAIPDKKRYGYRFLRFQRYLEKHKNHGLLIYIRDRIPVLAAVTKHDKEHIYLNFYYRYPGNFSMNEIREIKQVSTNVHTGS